MARYRNSFFSVELIRKPLRMRSLPLRFHLGKRGTFLDGRIHLTNVKSTKSSLPRAQERTLHLIIVVGNPESVLPDVLAIHTIEMIPKSMILSYNMLRSTIKLHNNVN
jgi:hypothetical protein